MLRLTIASRNVCVLGLLLLALSACSSSKDEPILFSSKRPAAEAEPPVKEVPADILAAQRAFSAVAKNVMPVVVNISTLSRKKMVRPFYDLPPFFEEFFGGPQTRQDRSLGSGFIISRDGYIVTNDHVVRDAEQIRVKLSNDKVYDARIVGGDPKTDIAVIKIDAADLPTAVLADSDRLEVGQWAIAIGNPFGLERSMTVGIISATGRSNVGIESIENFIQTDASINPGNSGGPLLNIHGEVIGINTAIVAAGQGIGFAIPTNMAKPIVAQLVEKGSVTRAWLGISIAPVSEDMAKTLKLPGTTGVLVAETVAGAPAERGGILAGDVIVDIGGVTVKTPSHLQQLVAAAKIGAPLRVHLIREGRRLELSIIPGNADSARPAPRTGRR
ncbi:trypsin-like peptidase domain-containing protein [Trichlorobacter ammonificans]|uniref:2-alkenal reductase n=1 Tax=Trichlorobacter ammonificans TaxID=2916410 RepID=A0ABN8HCB9_9BACT|nr:trypsin-like peptidase domain-containing protein [Trichlorobacter ammonificans]CAH2030407.1 2-alkenal reductase [Trichlorobacter ammonificans]